MNDKIQKLREYSLREFYDGFAFGVASSSMVAGVVDVVGDKSFDHPYLIGGAFLASMGLGFYNKIKYGENKGLSELEKELE
ncbi:MAG: hypothetical protein PVJ67_02860 [Candidatus Pacearchaeota archaeon]|jgi:hypothetical protein